MFAFLRGKIHSKEMLTGPQDRLVLDVNGVGYELCISRRTHLLLPQTQEDATVFTALAIRENEWILFGFATLEERQIFGLLQSVNGIGPKLALALSATFGPEELAEAIVSGDQKMISQAPGVGGKVAQRLILELKTKMEDWLHQRSSAPSRPGPSAYNQVHDEVENILLGLGYTATEINMTLKKAKENSIAEEVEPLVQFSLKVLGASSLS